MFTNEEIEKLIRNKIESDEELGEKSGGSGHLGYISYELGEFSTNQLSNGLFEIIYEYTLFVETEFTYEPDNPPYHYPHKKKLILNKNNEIINAEEIYEESRTRGHDFTDEDWQSAQKEILEFVEKFLARIEWKYGENRAPIKYPPNFYEILSEEHGFEYCCMIEEDLGDDEKLYFNAINPLNLVAQIKSEIKKRFPQHFE